MADKVQNEVAEALEELSAAALQYGVVKSTRFENLLQTTTEISKAQSKLQAAAQKYHKRVMAAARRG